jgi:sugar/nucleoside kinase (ribokinase family)
MSQHKAKTGHNVICFGYISPGQVFSVPKYPLANSGAYVSHKHQFIGADCTMVARTLAHWGMPVQLIGNALGNDPLGSTTLAQLHRDKVQTFSVQRDDLRTPEEIDVIDAQGTRTFFVDNTPVWNTLSHANLDPIHADNAALVYVDWYVGAAVHGAIARARAQSLPVYLNVEYSLRNPTQYLDLISHATFVQTAVDDTVPDHDDPQQLAQVICNAGAQVAFVTRGRFGALARSATEQVAVSARPIELLDAQGAGATFSAAAIYGLLHAWPLRDTLEFATHAATLKCAQHGLLRNTVAALRQTL